MDIARFCPFTILLARSSQLVYPSLWSRALKASPLEISLQARFQFFAYLHFAMPSLSIQWVKTRFKIHIITQLTTTDYSNFRQKTESEKQNIEMPFNYCCARNKRK